MSGVTGDFRGLRRLIDNLQKAVDGQLIALMAQNLAADARKLIADEFRGEHDPYGTPWKPLKNRHGKILQDTGRLRGDIGITPSSDAIRIVFKAPYAAVHQYGATVGHRSLLQKIFTKTPRRKGGVIPVDSQGRFMSKAKASRSKAKSQAFKSFKSYKQPEFKIPQRMLLPTQGFGGLGPIWAKRFARTSRRVLMESFGRVASGGE